MADSTVQVIIVEDEKADACIAQHILRQCKIRNPIIHFRSGHTFLEHMREISARSPDAAHEPSLLFLDLMMPNIGGLDVLSYLQSAPWARCYIPVMLSGLADMKLVNRGYQLGAKTFLLKPLTVDSVAELLNSLRDRVVVQKFSDGCILQWIAQAQPGQAFEERRWCA